MDSSYKNIQLSVAPKLKNNISNSISDMTKRGLVWRSRLGHFK